jgi:hypothetical protein
LEKTAVSRVEHVDRRCLADIAALKNGAEVIIGVGSPNDGNGSSIGIFVAFVVTFLGCH